VGGRRREAWRITMSETWRLGKGREDVMCPGSVERGVDPGRIRVVEDLRGAMGERMTLTGSRAAILVMVGW
jgi:hypothetical protein